MNLTVRIHDIEYTQEVAQGVTFAEEYNETLDSGSIRICHIGQIDNLRPYDDVYIYESGYVFDDYIALWRKGGTLHDGDRDEKGEIYNPDDPTAKRIPFYRHLLVDQFAEEIVNLDQGIFSYSIELCSETKGTEIVQVPNISVTQPLNINLKVDIYTLLRRFVRLYSPKYKTIHRDATGKKKWKYAQKYSVAPELYSIFGDVYSQDFTLSNPTLKDVLSTLMITKDMIPYVKDNVIYAKAISERTGTYNINTEKNSGRINMVVGQMSSNDYCDGVRRQYSNALSQNGTCHFVEHLGFRNKNNAIMTLDNMQLETLHPIYRVKKFYMCYYKYATILHRDVEEDETPKKDFIFLCKQDMTPLVKLQSEWNLLSQDWREMTNATSLNIKELSNYKLSTVTYDLGGNIISGWGTRYNEFKETTLNVFNVEKTYIENIFNALDTAYPFGISSAEELKRYVSNVDRNKIDIIPSSPESFYFSELGDKPLSHVYLPVDKNDKDNEYNEITGPLKFKTFFFEIEYEGFYSGALIHSRDKGNDNFFQNDNQSSSLTLLEKDGYSQKEKLNRFANKTITMKGRLDGENYGVDKLLKLGQTGAINNNDDDVIIYRREYSIFDNYILVSYAGVQDYVLKNFYTSVYARYRTNQLMSYGESTTRAENRKVILLLSKDKKFKDEEDTFLTEEVSNNQLLSAFYSNHIDRTINRGVVLLYGSKDNYSVDLNTFTSGKSLCFNVEMGDNASGGNFIKKWVSEYEMLMEHPSDDETYYTGSTQEWYPIVDNVETGSIAHLGFRLFHDNSYMPTILYPDNGVMMLELKEKFSSLKNLPKSPMSVLETSINNIIYSDYFYKDNKERINMTFQIEPISTQKNDIVFSEYLMKLSNLVSYNKYDSSYTIPQNGYLPPTFNILFKCQGYMDSYIVGIVGNKTDTLTNIKQRIKENGGEMNLSEILFAKEGDIGGSSNTSTFLFKANKIRVVKDGNDEFIELGGSGYIDHAGDGESWVTNLTSIRFLNSSLLEGTCAQWNTNDFSPKDAKISNFDGIAYVQKAPDIVVDPNMRIEFSESSINAESVYEILPYTETTLARFSSAKPSDVFTIVSVDGKESYIRVKLKDDNGNFLDGITDSTNSIIFWYFDFDAAYSRDYESEDKVYSYDPTQSLYHFVFGINITETDRTNGFVNIYVSRTTHRDERVFDSVGRQVGIIHNCVHIDEEDGTISYESPTQQEYDDKTDDNLVEQMVSAEVVPEGSGEIEGAGYYYKGEVVNLEFISPHPAGEYSFYGWLRDGNVYSTEKTISFTLSEYDGTNFIAASSRQYNICSTKMAAQPEFGPSKETIKVFAFNGENIDYNAVLKANIKMTIEGNVAIVSSLTSNKTEEISCVIDFMKNNSEDTAVNIKQEVTDFSNAFFYAKVWAQDGNIYVKGYLDVWLTKRNITIYMDSIDAAIMGNAPQSTLTLDFSDDKIQKIVIGRVDADVVEEIDRNDERVENNKMVVNFDYQELFDIAAIPTDPFTYTVDYPFAQTRLKAGLEMNYAPKTKVVEWETVWEGELQVSANNGNALVGMSNLNFSIPEGEIYSLIGAKLVLDFKGSEVTIINSSTDSPAVLEDGITFVSYGIYGTGGTNGNFIYIFSADDGKVYYATLKSIMMPKK